MKPVKNPSSIRLHDDIKLWLIQQAFKENRTLSNMVNKLLKDCKEQQEIKAPFSVEGHLVKGILKRFDKGER